jgi:putative tricarboxylic transport membrane protein
MKSGERMKPMFRDRDVTSSMFWALVGILFCTGGIYYGLRRSGIPGPGFLPFVTGLILVALSLTLLISGILRKRSGRTLDELLLPDRQALKRILQTLAALCFYALAVERLGFALTTFVFMIVVLRLEPRRWYFLLSAAIGATVFFFALFKILLKVPLPSGILGY